MSQPSPRHLIGPKDLLKSPRMTRSWEELENIHTGLEDPGPVLHPRRDIQMVFQDRIFDPVGQRTRSYTSSPVHLHLLIITKTRTETVLLSGPALNHQPDIIRDHAVSLGQIILRLCTAEPARQHVKNIDGIVHPLSSHDLSSNPQLVRLIMLITLCDPIIRHIIQISSI